MPLFRDPTDPRVLAALLRSAGFTPSRLRGQNFLIDASVADALVSAAELPRHAKVLEIGPGFGAITLRLAEVTEELVAVEAEPRIVREIRKSVSGTHVRIVHGDILRFPRKEYFRENFSFHLVSSLPYSITARVLRTFLALEPFPASITVLVQREVAERAVAPPGKLSQLGVLCQLYGEPDIPLSAISPAAFRPAPKVQSAILRITGIEEAWNARNDWRVPEASLWKVIRAGFQNRRKMVKNTLANLPGISAESVQHWLKEHRYNVTVRAQDIAPHDWVLLAQQLFQANSDHRYPRRRLRRSDKE